MQTDDKVNEGTCFQEMPKVESVGYVVVLSAEKSELLEIVYLKDDEQVLRKIGKRRINIFRLESPFLKRCWSVLYPIKKSLLMGYRPTKKWAVLTCSVTASELSAGVTDAWLVELLCGEMNTAKKCT